MLHFILKFKYYSRQITKIIEQMEETWCLSLFRYHEKEKLLVPHSNNLIEFSIEGPGEIVATDNGDQTNIISFSSKERQAFNRLALVIARSLAGNSGKRSVKAKSPG